MFSYLQIVVAPPFVVLLRGPGREVTGPVRVVVALVREEVVLLGRELDRPVVDGFQVTRRRRVNGVDFAAGRLLAVDVSAHGTRLPGRYDGTRDGIFKTITPGRARYGRANRLPLGASRGGENEERYF